MKSKEWMESANCSTADPEMFFPDQNSRWGLEKAQRICAECSVVAECLDYAQQYPDLLGIWGGLSQNQRARKRTDNRKAVRSHNEWALDQPLREILG